MKNKFTMLLLAIFICSAPIAHAEIIDNADDGFTATGTWHKATNSPGFYGDNYLYSSTQGDYATWTFAVTEPGTYMLSAQWAVYHNHSEAIQYVLTNGSQTYKAPLVAQNAGGGNFAALGTYSLQPGLATVKMTWDGGYASADAVQLVLIEPDAGASTRQMTIEFAVDLTQQDYDSLRLYRKAGDIWTLHQDFPKASLETKSDGLYFTTSMSYVIGDTYQFAATFNKKYPDGAYHPDDPSTIVYEVESALSNIVSVTIEPDPTANLETASSLDKPFGLRRME